MKRLVILLIILCFGPLVQAAVIHVSTTQDNIPGSLRLAITTANTNGEENTIYLPTGNYILTGESGEDANEGGDLDISTSYKLTIIGDGSETTIIDGNQIDRVLDILNGTVSITGVTIRKGKTANGDYLQDGEDGGGIKNAGKLFLNHCCVCDNKSGYGGNCHSQQYGEIAGNGGNGGGILNNGTIKFTRCIIKNNTTGYGGWGGLCQTGGKSGSGGGIYNNGTITFTECTISNNKTPKGGEACGGNDAGSGGGIYNTVKGDITLKKCTFNDNSTGNGGYAGCAGPPWHGGNGGNGGALYNEGSILLVNCTLSSNFTGKCGQTDSAPLGYGGSGGAIYNSGQIDIINCTITDNYADYIPYSYYIEHNGDGGGIYNNYYGSTYAKNTIIANNHVCQLDGEGPDFWGVLDSGGYNLIEDINYCSIIGIQTGNVSGEDPLLGTLAHNGGHTQTHKLLPGSPAIDAGNSSEFPEDQRGIIRPIDIPNIANASDGADIGAYEFNTSFTISGTIKYEEIGIANVTLTFSNNGGITTSNENGYYSHNIISGWSGTVTPSKEGYDFTPQNKKYTSVTTDQTDQDYAATPTTPPQISLSRTQLNFGVEVTGNQTNPQTFLINNNGVILLWTLSVNASWLSCSPTSGTNSGEVTVSVDASGLSPGTYNGAITVSAPNASNSPQTVNITMVVYKANTTGIPFGYFETPCNEAYVYSSIPVTGWALDDIEVESVKIYREESKNLVYIGDALLVEGARPDVEQAYPDYPMSYRAGWGYMMLTNFLPNGGNGYYILHAIATDKEGNQVTLGTKTIECDNANAVKPFGAIDTPPQGGTAAGTNYRNQGWVLTPIPNKIPEDGHTIIVWIDGVDIGNPIYNIYRSDIAALFPGYANSNGAMAYFDFDTTTYENGVHTIQWTAADDAGNTDGIGSRYFTVQNSGTRQQAAGNRINPDPDLLRTLPDHQGPVRIKKGYDKKSKSQTLFPDYNGNITIEIKELQRIEIDLKDAGANPAGPPANEWLGYQVIGNQLRPLPVGSYLDSKKGIFSWQPGPGFINTYGLLFIARKPTDESNKRFITIKILSKFSRRLQREFR